MQRPRGHRLNRLAAIVAVVAACLCTATTATAQEAELSITADGPGSTLHGTMAGHVAGESRPVVVIIPGSGPTDRNGNSPLGMTANTHGLLPLAPGLVAAIAGFVLAE